MNRSDWATILRGASVALRAAKEQDASRRRQPRQSPSPHPAPAGPPPPAAMATKQEHVPPSALANAAESSEPESYNFRLAPPTPPPGFVGLPVAMPRIPVPPPSEPDTADVEVPPDAIAAASEHEPVAEPSTMARSPEVDEAGELDLHAVLVHAVAQAVEAVEARRTSDALHILVTAQEEHQALMVAAIKQVRDECNATMIRLADRLTAATEHLARAFETYTGAAIPAALAEVSEQARMSSGEISGALRTMVKQNHYVIEALSVQRERDDRLVELLGRIHAAVDGASDPASDAEPTADATSAASSRHTPASDPPEVSLYERLTDIIDDYDEEDDAAAELVAMEEPGHVH